MLKEMILQPMLLLTALFLKIPVEWVSSLATGKRRKVYLSLKSFLLKKKEVHEAEIGWSFSACHERRKSNC
jgi:poly-D-alanine transfer protein DltD